MGHWPQRAVIWSMVFLGLGLSVACGRQPDEMAPVTPLEIATPTVWPPGDTSPRFDPSDAAATFPAATSAPALPTPPPAEPTPENAEPQADTPLTEPPPPNETGAPVERTHIVAAGETLYSIGMQYGLSWVDLATYNGLPNPDAIDVGQELRIPPTTPTPEGAAP